MSNGLAPVAGGLVGLAALGGLAAAASAWVRRGRPYLADGLFVAVGGPADPVTAAVRAGYAGLEVAVRLEFGVLRLVCGPPGTPAPAFEGAVLEPLAARVAASPLGRVYARRAEPFLLMIRAEPEDAGPGRIPDQPGCKDAAGATARPVNGAATATLVDTVVREARTEYVELDRLLRPHATMFTSFVGGRVVPGAITVVLTGPRWARADLLGAYERYAFLEGRFSDLEPGGLPASVAPVITETLATRLGWDPREEWPEFPAEARHTVRSLVLAAHVGGRRVRFGDVPEEPRRVRAMFWRELRAAGVDVIGSRHRGALARFLRQPASTSRKHRANPTRYAAESQASRKVNNT